MALTARSISNGPTQDNPLVEVGVFPTGGTGDLQAFVPVDNTGVPLVLATQTTLAALLTELMLKADLTETQPVSATIAKTPLTPSSPTFATVGVASGVAVAANASRKGLVLTNASTATISFGLAATAVLGSGITLYPGGIWVMDEYTFCTGAVNAIASAGASNLSVQEFV